LSIACNLFIKHSIMKRVIKFLSVVVITLFVTTTFAQQTPPAGAPTAQPPAGQGGQRVQQTPEATAKAQVDWMTTDLKINAATQTKVYDVVLKYTKQINDERTKAMAAGGDMQAMRTKTTEINSLMDNELKVILGDATYAQYTTKAAERRAAARPQGMPQGAPPQGRGQ
jgi:hypothetical protein